MKQLHNILLKKISKKNIIISIIGIGYVGLPLSVAFAKKYKVLAYDNDKKKIKLLKLGHDKINNFKKKELLNKNLKFTDRFNDISISDIIIITLPTPINSKFEPDMSNIFDIFKKFLNHYIKNKLIILESTVYPGASAEFINFIENKTNLKVNKDFYFGYSPERINPGDKKNTIYNISKIVSASNKNSLLIVKKLYKSILNKVYLAKEIMYAEMAKIIENCQRDINVAFINEISLICKKLKINTYDVLKLAETKWNFLKFYPGLVGGHCIGVDPYYLAHKAKKLNYNPKVILAGRSINESMSKNIANEINLNIKKNSKILLMGIAYKKDSNDFRNSKSLDIAKILKTKNHKIFVYDPLCFNQSNKKINFNNNIYPINRPLRNYYDSIIISVDHSIFKKISLKKIRSFGKKNCVIYDVKNIFPNQKGIKYL